MCVCNIIMCVLMAIINGYYNNNENPNVENNES